MTPYDAGIRAGQALHALLSSRQDTCTLLVEWYRGFCAGAQFQSNPSAERALAHAADTNERTSNAGFVAARQAGQHNLGAKFGSTFDGKSNCLDCQHDWAIDKECAICDQPLGPFTKPSCWKER
jgi:hypothetical protein